MDTEPGGRAKVFKFGECSKESFAEEASCNHQRHGVCDSLVSFACQISAIDRQGQTFHRP